ncbi:unnamed protein product [Prorocentrum cordatum]|uniref:Uncharacterized protein n=1 Tax=Prorocentrum cordatum TaxID=2364126 RepID=A0ABN9PRC4_9DINO|nr:unnamed protein product [Polarella glacialis]
MTRTDDIAGEVPLLYAIRETGEVVARFNLTGFDPMNELVWTKGGRVDVEAIQTGWCFTDGDRPRVSRPHGASSLQQVVAVQARPAVPPPHVGHNCARTGCEFVRKSGGWSTW